MKKEKERLSFFLKPTVHLAASIFNIYKRSMEVELFLKRSKQK